MVVAAASPITKAVPTESQTLVPHITNCHVKYMGKNAINRYQSVRHEHHDHTSAGNVCCFVRLSDIRNEATHHKHTVSYHEIAEHTKGSAWLLPREYQTHRVG